MDGDEHIRELLLELSIIGQIKGGHRVFTSNGTISVSPPAHFDGVSRWWNQERRDRNIKAIERTLYTAYTVMDSLLSKIDCATKMTTEKSSFQEKMELKSASQRLKRFCDALQESKGGNGQGISELLVTYAGDITITSRIKHIIGNIDDKLEQVNLVVTHHRLSDWSEFVGAATSGGTVETKKLGSSQCLFCKSELGSTNEEHGECSLKQQQQQQGGGEKHNEIV